MFLVIKSLNFVPCYTSTTQHPHPNTPQTIPPPTLLIRPFNNRSPLTPHNTTNPKPFQLNNNQTLLRIPQNHHLTWRQLPLEITYVEHPYQASTGRKQFVVCEACTPADPAPPLESCEFLD